MNSETGATTLQRGGQAEALASRFLQKKGLKLCERNYRCKTGEIDLIMELGDQIVFVEVRMRRNPSFGTAAETVDRRKQQRLIRTAQHYLQRYRFDNRPCRFDIIAIDGDQQIEWLQNAFGLY